MRTKLDSRHTIRLEYVGHSQPRHVFRFCGDYVGHRETYKQARSLAIRWEKQRKKNMGKVSA